MNQTPAPISSTPSCVICGNRITAFDTYGVGKLGCYHWNCIRAESRSVSPIPLPLLDTLELICIQLSKKAEVNNLKTLCMKEGVTNAMHELQMFPHDGPTRIANATSILIEALK